MIFEERQSSGSNYETESKVSVLLLILDDDDDDDDDDEEEEITNDFQQLKFNMHSVTCFWILILNRVKNYAHNR